MASWLSAWPCMNYLAHIYLSGNDQQILCGNFIGDGIRRKESMHFSHGVRRGIELHHFIDGFTDHHPETENARKLLRPVLRKYAGVALDIYFDHFLGAKWNQFHEQALEHFAHNCHGLLDTFEPRMPEKSRRFYHYMKAHNWLVNYRDMKALNTVFAGMSRRSRFPNNMHIAVELLEVHYEELGAHFERFFPELQRASSRFLDQK
ncbi:MAG: DUF479 domain-containing protein [Cryomorphaceae bacterium]|nr:MAG: DUF479 domain-containing protein [Cryomorphaceae bacterium]